MAANFLFPPPLIPRSPLSTRSSTAIPSFFTSIRSRRIREGRRFHLHAAASFSCPPINVDYLEQEFDAHGHGVSFEAIGDECIAKLRLESGAFAIVMLPSGLITSYKPPMWHGGSLELLHSSVSSENGADAVVRGGVSLALTCDCDRNGPDFSPRNWSLRDIRGNPRDSIQVELFSSDSEGLVEFKYVVTLEEDMLTSEVIVSNNKQTPLNLLGCVLSHLTVSTPEATYVVGLERSNFCSTAPLSSNCAIIPPDYGQGSSSGWTLQGALSGWGRSNRKSADQTSGSQRDGEEIEGEETENYKQLTEAMSRIYTCAPRNFTIIDRGRRNSVVIGRDGFDELYMFSPGSNHVFYGEYSYICVGQSAILKPIVLGPQQEWRGSQQIYNPNL